MTSDPSPALPGGTLPAPGTRAAQVRSRKILLYFLLIIFTFWVLMMLAMYYTTVYPRRHHSRAVDTTPSSELPTSARSPAGAP